MPKLSIDLFKQDKAYLIVSCLIFPVSLEISLFCFLCFLVIRILFFDSRNIENRSDEIARFIKLALVIAIAISMGEFYWESRSHFYPVSYYDYLFVFITVLTIKIFPFKPEDIQNICFTFIVSPLIVFIVYLPILDFSLRNHWGFGNPNWLGFYCSICIPIICCRMLNSFSNVKSKLSTRQKITQRSFILPALSLLACFIMLISSGSRSCLYTSSFMIILILYLKIKSNWKKLYKYNFNSKIKAKIIIFSTGCFLILVSLYKLVFTKFIFLERFIDLDNSTNIYRVKIYQCYLNYGIKKPWWGWGFNKAAAFCEEKLRARYGGVNHAHNFILQLFTDRGLIITLLCLIGIAYFIFFPSLILIFNCNFSLYSTVYLGINLSSLSIIITSLFQSAFYHYPLFPLWLGLLWGFQITINKNLPSTS